MIDSDTKLLCIISRYCSPFWTYDRFSKSFEVWSLELANIQEKRLARPVYQDDVDTKRLAVFADTRRLDSHWSTSTWQIYGSHCQDTLHLASGGSY